MKQHFLNISLEEICKDTRSLTRIANLVLDKQNLSFTRITNELLKPKARKFNSKDLCFNYIVESENDTYIEITHKKKSYFVENWKIYIEKDDFSGLRIKLLEGVNYTYIKNSDLIGKFIKYKKWINNDYLSCEVRKINNQIDILNSKNRLLQTFCS